MQYNFIKQTIKSRLFITLNIINAKKVETMTKKTTNTYSLRAACKNGNAIVSKRDASQLVNMQTAMAELRSDCRKHSAA